jgi:hypothetical protein
MAFTSLSDRLAQNRVPLVLAGPVLRRVEPDQVTVWIALREAQTVSLSVFAGGSGAGQPILTGQRATVEIGDNLHVVAVTAQVNSPVLSPGTLYSYDLDLGGTALDDAGGLKLTAGGRADLAYAGTTHPTFSLPLKDMAGVRLVHGSCRKAHAPGRDALTALDLMIEEAAKTASSFAQNRPHQLFLTGDQVYGDDVADAMLEMVTEAGKTLLGWEEIVPLTAKHPSEIKPGARQEVAEMGKLTSTEAKSHLMGLGEYYAIYLFAWADTIWPPATPQTGSQDERDGLALFKAGLPAVRRALANVPTYMIFDDHEVTDDWFLNRRWCVQGVPSAKKGGAAAHPLARRIIQNALLAYALFQAWGNTPDQFAVQGAGGAAGRALLQAATDWSRADGKSGPGKDALAEIEKRTGLAPALSPTDDALVKPAGALAWHYTVVLPGWPYEVIVLDSRTMRGYDHGRPSLAPAGLLSPAAFQAQLESLPAAPTGDGVTVVVAPAPVFGIPLIERLQGAQLPIGDVFTWDAEAWGLDEITLQRFISWLGTRRSRVVLLSGDVHYAFAARLAYWATHPYKQPALATMAMSVIAQLTSSALHNEAYGMLASDRQHRGGYNHYHLPSTAPPDDVKGWNVAPSTTDMKIGLEKRSFTWRDYRLKDPAVLHHSDKPPAGTFVNVLPDWRYTVVWLRGVKTTTLPAPTPINAFPGSPAQAVVKTAEFQKEYANALDDHLGRDVVGRNNIGELLFDWPAGAGPKQVRQRLWWTPHVNAEPAPITTHTISLDPDPPPP